MDRARQEILIRAVGYGLLHPEDLRDLNQAGAERVGVWDALSAFGLGWQERALLEGKLEALSELIFEGRYVLLSELGRGGMGVVSRAFDTTLNRVVALKRLLPEAAASNAWDRFFREARSLARLDHPSCVRVYDFGVGQASEMPYMALQLVLGRTLRERIEDALPPPWEEVTRWGRQLAEGLAACHSVGLVHRDIKPANILLERTRPSRALLADFGIAFTVGESERLTRAGGFLGTYLYCAPETLDQRGAEPNPRSDLYSLGLSLYVALSGVHPYDAGSLPALLDGMGRPIRPLQELAPDAPPWLATAIHRCLERDPKDRFADATELAYALSGGQSGAHALPRARSQPVEPAPRKSRWPLALAGLALLAVGHLSGRVVGREALAPSLAIASRPPGATPTALARTTPVREVAPSPSRAPGAGEASLLHLGGREYRNLKDDSVLIKIPGGTFRMGGPKRQPGTSGDDEAPAHWRSLKTYYLGKLEVNWRQWRAFCRATGRPLPPQVSSIEGQATPVSDEHPATSLNLEDARAYARWAGLRLPTEAEWEYAARGNRGRLYPWGNVWLAKGSRLANVIQTLEPGESESLRRTKTSPIDAFPGTSPGGSFPRGASPFGCLDMCGNVYEWVEGTLQPYPGGRLVDESRRGDALVRGGSYRGSAWSGRTATRGRASPAARHSDFGLRVAKSAGD